MDREEFLELLRTEPAFREEVRRQLLTDDVLALPGRLASLTESVGQIFPLLREIVGVVRDLAAAQQRTEAGLQGQEAHIQSLIAAQQHTEVQMQLLTVAQQRTAEGLQRQETQLQSLIAAQQRTEVQMQSLTVAQQRTEVQMQSLTVAQQRTEVQMQSLTVAQQHTAEELQWLVSWQRGESGRRDGERYERETLRRAPALFNGGRGGAPDQPWVQQRLTERLDTLMASGMFEAEEDPFLGDLLWWKGEQVAVTEISLQVDGHDVVRAVRRAGTLRRAGAQALAVVIGDNWATPEVREQAQAGQVAWKVGSDLSEDFLTFRRASSEAPGAVRD